MIVFKLASFSFRQIIGMRFYSLVLVKKNSPPPAYPHSLAILSPFCHMALFHTFPLLTYEDVSHPLNIT